MSHYQLSYVSQHNLAAYHSVTTAGYVSPKAELYVLPTTKQYIVIYN
jgi:hypothetical protein